MAKITGPLLSESAHGMVGPRLTFSKRSTGQQARYQRSNTDANTAPQQTQRTLFLEARDKWQLLSPAQKVLWKDYNNS
jgi:hypothetical protein